MDQRMYHGNIDPHALADYLVGVFNNQPAMHYGHSHSMAQKISQGERVYVQIMRVGEWSGYEHNALSVQILRTAGGVSISMGQSDWLDLDQGGLAGMLLGALLFPPLLLFPVLSGLTRSNFAHDVWEAIDNYCIQARPRNPRPSRGFYCSYCGAFNHPAAAHCHSCGAPFDVTAPPHPEQPGRQQTPDEQQAAERASNDTVEAEQVVCAHCGATVAAAKFCGNCAAPLR
ncbi:MAG TPA: zinc ribbon domain-containing protein [Ktedonobacteraceae bacterium]|nr:zinc ribbon domain-containing protein [Ktedonobacteraceae bacterium]